MASKSWGGSFWDEQAPDHLSTTLSVYYLIGPTRLWGPPCFFFLTSGTVRGAWREDWSLSSNLH